MIHYFSQLDSQILIWIQNNIVNPKLTPVITVITYLGNAAMIWIIIAIILAIHKKTRTTGILTMISLLITFLIVNVLLKNTVARVRPYDAYELIITLIGPQSDFSFPSGHTASSFAAAIVLFERLPKKYSFWFLILAVAISLSRLYLGVHYPSDVLGGAAMGTMIAIGVIIGGKRILKE